MIDYYQPIPRGQATHGGAAGRIALRIALWITAVILTGILLGSLVAPALGGAPAAMLFPFMLLALALLLLNSHVMVRVRRRRLLATISYLEQAVRLNLPLVPWLAAASASERGAMARRLDRLVLALGHALPISQAVEMAIPEADPRHVAAMAAAEQTGALAAALRRLLREEQDRSPAEIANHSFRTMYSAMMIFMITMTSSLILVFVIPKFEQIFMDFGIRLPAATVLLLNIARDWGAPLALVAVVSMIFIVARALERTFLGHGGRSLLRPITDRLGWRLPIARASVRSVQYGDFCAAMAAAMQGAMPMRRAVEQARTVATNTVFRRQVDRWQARMDEGASPAEAARQAGLPEVWAGLLATSTDGHNAADIFGFLARYYQTRFSRAQALLRAGAMPLIVLAFAGVVGFVAFALFKPMIELIEVTAVYVAF